MAQISPPNQFLAFWLGGVPRLAGGRWFLLLIINREVLPAPVGGRFSGGWWFFVSFYFKPREIITNHHPYPAYQVTLAG